MKHVRLKFVVDPDVFQLFNIREPALIGYYVTAYLNDPDGWAKHGYYFEQVDNHERTLIRLSTPETIKKICGLPGNLSCAELGGRFMYLNADRWFNGAPKSKLSLEDYRQYMVSHEIGHILGYEHEECLCKGCSAPVMMQQTLGIGKCKPNTKI